MILNIILHIDFSAGCLVYPGEIERILYQHPLVELALILGIYMKDKGEDIITAVVKTINNEDVNEQTLLSLVNDQVKEYKRYSIFI